MMKIADVKATGFYQADEFGKAAVRVYRITDKGIVMFRTNAGCGGPAQLHVKHFAEMFRTI